MFAQCRSRSHFKPGGWWPEFTGAAAVAGLWMGRALVTLSRRTGSWFDEEAELLNFKGLDLTAVMHAAQVAFTF